MVFFLEGLQVSADYQTYGKGRRNNFWDSNKKENILLSVMIAPNILINRQFDITKSVLLSLVDLCDFLGIKTRIKWPNDLLINNQKIAGVLIENIVSNNLITNSVIGIPLADANRSIGTIVSPCPPSTMH